MSEVTAEMIENGRVRDPASATRRRKMTVKMRPAREKLTTSSDRASAYAPDFLRLFAQSHQSATPFMCLLVIAIGIAALVWVPPVMVLAWTALTSMAMALLYGFSIAFLDSNPEEANVGEWRLKFILVETFYGVAWALIVILLLKSHDPSAR